MNHVAADLPHVIPNVTDLDLRHTLESAQSFRWERRGPGYLGPIRDEVCYLEQRDTDLYWRSTVASDQTGFLRYYLDLDRSLQPLDEIRHKDRYIEIALSTFWGMRLLRQDLWECLASFILSANNNVARIRRIIARLAAQYGKPVEFDGETHYGFPLPEVLAACNVDELRACGMGYRAPYLHQTSIDVVTGQLDLDQVKQANYPDARNMLMQCAGVGEKVADCVCLFSLGHLQALPVDVWIRRIIEVLYLHKPSTYQQIREFGLQYFGEYIGYVQQYLFHYARTVGYSELRALQ